MSSRSLRLPLRPRRVALTAFLALSLLTLGSPLTSTRAAAHAAPRGAVPTFHYQSGYTLQYDGEDGRTWLCYGWPNGALHCTKWWKRSAAGLTSLNASWVPTPRPVTKTPPPPPPPPAPSTASGDFCPGVSRASAWTIGAIGQWSVPPGCFAGVFYPSPSHYAVGGSGFGWCNWWPEALRGSLSLLARPRVSAPSVGAAVVFAGGVQGASSAGHYAYVESVGTGRYSGWLLISEMNFYWRGGGFARVTFRYIHTGPGVSFIP